MSSRANRYATAHPPEDPNQEYMTVQETAWVMKCSVTWLRRFLTANPHLCGRNGNRKRIITDREQRAAIHAARTAGDPRTGRTMPRPRRATGRKTAPAAA